MRLSQLYSALAVLLLLATACKKEITPPSASNSTEELVTRDIPASFLEFYELFHSDQKYQMEHIVFPLAGQEQDGVTHEVSNVQWQEEDWVMHKPFNSYGGTFKRDYLNINGLIVEKIQDTGKTFTMERRFSFIAGDWQLIYYSTFEMAQ